MESGDEVDGAMHTYAMPIYYRVEKVLIKYIALSLSTKNKNPTTQL